MMRTAFPSLALALLSAMSAPALAQPRQGAPGERSRSVIRISVSVAPAFKRETQSRPPGAAALQAITSVDPSLRYALVTRPMDGPSFDPARKSSPAGTLVLVVPD
jgi:hypothetical protein